MITKKATKFFSKLFGRKAGAVAGTVADEFVTTAADALTAGKASKIEAKVKKAKAAKDILGL